MIDPTNARQSRGIWARAVARRVLDPRIADAAPVQAEVAAPTARAPRLEEMYAELALRTAGLLEQQHALLDSLERDETEPGRLDQLFAIDHLIAQARRHADSLRLLTDGSAGRPCAELTVDDVLHAAASSVQDYPRVHIEVTVAQHVTAAASADMVHLVTEMLDQALTASTDSAVVVTTAREGEALRIEILHQGGPQDSRQSTSSHLVDLLAQRHGVRVDLRSEPNGASVVSIVVPASALVELPQATAMLVDAPD
ncbi:MAG: ATP-binding protein, partial [Nocardioides sp.]